MLWPCYSASKYIPKETSVFVYYEMYIKIPTAPLIIITINMEIVQISIDRRNNQQIAIYLQ